MIDWQNDPMAREFIDRLTELTRETGIVVYGLGDWPRLEGVQVERRTADYGYRLTSWGEIEWMKLTSVAV